MGAVLLERLPVAVKVQCGQLWKTTWHACHSSSSWLRYVPALCFSGRIFLICSASQQSTNPSDWSSPFTSDRTTLKCYLAWVQLEAKVKDKTPYVVVALQEVVRMNSLLSEMKASMEELLLGLDGALNMSDKMEKLATGISTGVVPELWRAQVSTRFQEVLTLPAWYMVSGLAIFFATDCPGHPLVPWLYFVACHHIVQVLTINSSNSQPETGIAEQFICCLLLSLDPALAWKYFFGSDRGHACGKEVPTTKFQESRHSLYLKFGRFLFTGCPEAA